VQFEGVNNRTEFGMFSEELVLKVGWHDMASYWGRCVVVVWILWYGRRVFHEYFVSVGGLWRSDGRVTFSGWKCVLEGVGGG
jgi:hypothetical protein